MSYLQIRSVPDEDARWMRIKAASEDKTLAEVLHDLIAGAQARRRRTDPMEPDEAAHQQDVARRMLKGGKP